MNRRIAVRAVVYRDSQLLCVKLKGYKASIDGDYWCLPGGTVEESEALAPALAREIREETNVSPHIGNLLYINHFKANDGEHLEFFFHVTNAEDYTNVDLSKASHAAEEIAELSFVDPKTVHILPEFLRSVRLDKQISKSLPTKVFTYFD